MIAPQTGSLLIAEPFLKDPDFMRAVVLICRHTSAEGSFGFVLNKLFEKTLDKLIPGLDEAELPVYTGGPVQMDTLHYIHQYPVYLPDSQKICDNVYWGGNFEMVKQLIKNKEIDTDKIRFFLGYSGWSEGQLDGEIREKSWLTVEANERLIFDTPPADVWKASLQEMGGSYKMMAHFPTDPQLN